MKERTRLYFKNKKEFNSIIRDNQHFALFLGRGNSKEMLNKDWLNAKFALSKSEMALQHMAHAVNISAGTLNILADAIISLNKTP